MRYTHAPDTHSGNGHAPAGTFDMLPLSFELIDQQIAGLDMPGLSQPPLQTGAAVITDAIVRLVMIYRATRPILVVIAGLPLILPGWRKVIEMFVATLDAIAAATDPAFKAGKDQ